MLEAIQEQVRAALERGESVSSISNRAGITRTIVSNLRNGRFEDIPNLTFRSIFKVLSAVGCKGTLKVTKRR